MTAHVLPRRALGALLTLALALTLLPGLPARAQTTTWADLDPWEIAVGYTAPFGVSAFGFETTWGTSTTVAVVNDSTEVEVSGAAGNLTVTDATNLTFDLLVSLDEGSYTVEFTTGDEIAYASLSILTPYATLDPSALGEGYPGPQTISVTGTATTWDTTTAVDVYHVDPETSAETLMTGAASIAGVSDATTLSMSLEAGLAAGDYLARFTTGTATADGNLSIADPSVSLTPGHLAEGATANTAFEAWGSWTYFEEGQTTLEILDHDGTPISDGAGSLVVDHTEYATFELLADLPAGTYTARFTTGAQVADGTFEVAAPSVFLSQSWFEEGYEPAPLDAYGMFTSFSSGTTQVAVLDATEAEVSGAVTDLVVNDPEWLSFTLASLPAGDYTVRVTTGSEVVSDTFTVQGPEIYVSPSEIGGAYETPYTVWVDGHLTDFSDGSTSVDILDAGTRDPIAGVVDNVVVADPSTLTFDLIGSPMPEGDYVVRVTTTTQTLEAPLSVVPPTPYVHLDPQVLPADYTAPQSVAVTGFHTHFDGTTTVEVGTHDWETDTFTPVSGAAGPASVTDATHLTFDLETVLGEDTYMVRITTGSEVVSEWLSVERWIWASPDRLPVGYSAPQPFTVGGFATSFEPGTTAVDILDDTSAAIPSAAGNISVADPDFLTFDLLAELAEGTYTIRVTTGSEVEETTFDVARWMDIDPWQLPTGHPVGETVTAVGSGTTFTQGTTAVTIHDGLGDEVVGAVDTVTVTDATHLAFTLGTSLPEGWYQVKATTGAEVVDSSLTVTRWIELDPHFLDTGYATPQPMTVNGFGTSFSDGVTTVEVIDWSTDVPVDGAVAASSVSVTSATALTFDLALSLPEGTYYVRVTTGDEVMDGYLTVWDDTSPPWVSLDPSLLPSDHPVPTTIQANGSNTSFDPSGTVVEILDGTGTPMASAVGSVSVSNATQLTFDVATLLPYGTHDVRITTGDEVVLASLHVADPWAWASPNTLSVGYPSTTIGITGGYTSFQDGVTSVAVVDEADTVQTGAVGDLTVTGTTSLSFTLASGLTAGYYRIVVTTGDEAVEAFLWVRQPTISLHPTYLDAGYSPPKTVEVYGSGTSFDSSTTVEVHGSAGAIDTVGTVNVIGATWLTFPVEQSLAEGSYTVRVTTGSEVVEAPFHVVVAKATTSSSTGSTSVDPATGEVAVSMPVGSPSDLTVTTTPTCADSSTPTAVDLVHDGKTYAMSPVGDGTWAGTIPAADLTNGDIGIRVTCSGTTTDEKVGEIVLYDPAGNVTNSVTGAPVVGATVTLFKVPGWMPKQSADDTTPDTCQSHLSKDADDPWNDPARTDLGVQVDASSPEIDPNLNPQTTNSVGRYGWFTAEGCWYVVVSKDGYVTQTSPMVGVPPEVTDLDVSLVPVPDTTDPTWPGDATMTSSALGETQVGLSWPAASDDTSVDSYEVLRDGVPVGTTTGTSFTVTGLSPATGYTFSVEASDPSGNTADGPAVAVTTVDLTAPAWPTGASLTASGVTETALTLAWTAATDNVGVTGYRVLRDGTSVATTAASVRTLDVSGLTAGTTYTFEVEAFDAATNESTAGPSEQVETASADTGGTDGGGTTDGGTEDGGTTDGGTTDGGTTDGGTEDGGTDDGGTTDGGPDDGTRLPEPGTVGRLAGLDRYATAAAISAATFDAGVPVAFIATGAGFPDALAGGPIAAEGDGPILLTAKDDLPGATDVELSRLQPQRIVILGGESVISRSVAEHLEGFTAGTVSRLAGADRYETAAAISAATYETAVPVVYIATGAGFPDALAGGAAAGRDDGPVLLVSPGGLPEATERELERLRPDRIIVLGGEAVVSSAVVDQLEAFTPGSVTRSAGANRYETAVDISASFAPGVPVVYVATGLDFPDALAGVPVAGTFGAPILLVPGDHIPQVVADELTRLEPGAVRTLGGSAVVSDAVLEQLRGYVAG